MDSGWAPVFTSLAPIVTAIGLGFGWLIKQIVSSSKEAVKELKLANQDRETKLEAEIVKAETERDTWRDRAYRAGWKEDV